ncbi:hypothetical protein KGF56_004264 [Candida oxycetoniae]|uniref:VanZ-like domain-containing protein n=1 Tax=Candida oxycetoniae TaxID=497107 RepID=A0AAI9SUA2_9ASCO|nr:uncharacterized protein KGF56_004264 [Candida oxycetoniae]KAI3403011.2 hypothetical protein KGF56_004264 [Candida oxycetoniae]
MVKVRYPVLIITLEFYFIFDAPFKSLKIIRYLTFVICTLAGSLGSEILQHIVNPARVFDPYDILCNVLGSLLGLGISITYSHYKKGKAKKERFRYNRLMNSDLRAVEEIVLEEGDCSVANGENSGRSTPNDYVNIQMKDF